MKRKFTAEWDDESRSWIIYGMTNFLAVSIYRKEIGNDNNWKLDVF